MKKKGLCWSVLLLVSMGIVIMIGTPHVCASERGPGWSGGFGLGTAWFLDGYLSTGFSGNIFFEYAPYIHEIGVRFTGGYLRFSDTVNVGRGSFTSREEVNYDNWFLTGGLVYRFSRTNVVPYVLGNLGVYRYHKEDVNPGVGPIIDGEQVSPYNTIVKNQGYAFGLNGGVGLEFFMSQTASISLQSLVYAIFGSGSDQIIDVTLMFRFFPEKWKR